MSPAVFDDVHLSAMRRAIDQIMHSAGEEARLRRLELANAVFALAREDGEFDPTKLAILARVRLALGMTNGANSEEAAAAKEALALQRPLPDDAL
jgi:hypothetical protein